MDDTDLCYLSAAELIQLYSRRELSPVEVAHATLRRIEAVDGELNAFVTVSSERALEDARAAETAYATGTAGPLAGVPGSLKDLTATRGIRTTRGSLLYEDWIPDEDSPLAQLLARAGMVLLGKTNTPELGWKGDTSNRVAGSTHNPWRHGRTAGGSSGGAAAAVVAGMGPIAQGTDGAGSVRIPAGLSGCFGLKPSWGRVPQFPSSFVETLSHAGPLARTVTDAAMMLNAMSAPDDRDRVSLPKENVAIPDLDAGISGLVVAWSRDLGYAAVEPEVADTAEVAARCFSELGCKVEEAHPATEDPWRIVHAIWSGAFAAAFGESLEQVRSRLDPGLVTIIEQGRRLSGMDVAGAYITRNNHYQAWREFFQRYDLLLTPTLPVSAFPAGTDFPTEIAGRTTTYLSWTAFTYPFNVTGHPAATVPCGFVDGLPVGLQIVGGWRQDAMVLRAARAFEQFSPWQHRRPPL
ncbi:MAG: amidase [Candidatus Latescibacterota bacterium]|nr:amidase [Candidatus Latescibacterota bacterium]